MSDTFRKIGVVGAGSWGTALALLLERNGHNVCVWGHDAEAIDRLHAQRENRAYLPGVPLPATIACTASLETLSDADLLLLVPPSSAMREVAARLSTVALCPDAVLLSCTKGVERGSGLRMSQILEETLPGHPLAVLSGPSHAEEVARQAPTAVVLGCVLPDLLAQLQAVFCNATFRAYTSNDITGIELGGALKNIFALAAGISDGLQLGDNTKAALVTRSLAELVRLGVALGGKQETFQGLSGIGDLMVTCFSKHSRNRSVGERLGKGESLGQIVSSMSMIAEGVPTTYSAHECARKLHVQTPIIDQIRLILEGALSPAEAMTALLSRDPRPE
ncbi:MAG: glycerol-3-phosphate dehydrogenase (NAD(P)+) [Verrucomicrobia bacterium]|nr:MAG: glycerol-3-phosphate dehydrogenase (NAD(P)+) [Verrucomicrobiota bacterium]